MANLLRRPRRGNQIKCLPKGDLSNPRRLDVSQVTPRLQSSILISPGYVLDYDLRPQVDMHRLQLPQETLPGVTVAGLPAIFTVCKRENQDCLDSRVRESSFRIPMVVSGPVAERPRCRPTVPSRTTLPTTHLLSPPFRPFRKSRDSLGVKGKHSRCINRHVIYKP